MLKTLSYQVDGRIARITLNRPDRGNGIVPEMPIELAACVERANLNPEVHVIALAGNGKGFCGGYDLVASAESMGSREWKDKGLQGSPLDPSTTLDGHLDGRSAKMGLDATRPLSYPGHTFTRVRVPGEEKVDLALCIDPNPAAVISALLPL